mmetsp:Transcript_25569/g.43116  ORF Transcript_25569/g.43116 Transcript_25569/m.43116 type:complete len:197 (-) Transcript_25569:76-666(-)
MMKHQDQIRLGTTTTLDEPVSETILRDVRQVFSKLRIVLIPLGSDSHQSVLQKLKEWDLWGPLLVCLMLSVTLSVTAPSSSSSVVFAAVFVIVWCGAALVTLNAQLLGGNLSFFQSVCILGYCVFPLTLSSLTCLFIGLLYNQIFVKFAIVAVGFIWSTRASVVFMGEVISPERKTLAVFPVLFFYTFISWMILLQ